MKCCEWHERLEFSLEPNKEALNTHHSLIKKKKKVGSSKYLSTISLLLIYYEIQRKN